MSPPPVEVESSTIDPVTSPAAMGVAALTLTVWLGTRPQQDDRRRHRGEGDELLGRGPPPDGAIGPALGCHVAEDDARPRAGDRLGDIHVAEVAHTLRQ